MESKDFGLISGESGVYILLTKYLLSVKKMGLVRTKSDALKMFSNQ